MEEKRKGARSFKELDICILDTLNKGECESVNLTEWLAVDQKILLQNFLEKNNRQHYLDPIMEKVDKLKKQTTNTMNDLIGENLFHLSQNTNDRELFPIMATHVSDTVRCWAAYMIAKNPDLSIANKLKQIEPFATDPHFGVREISWLSIRHDIIENLHQTIKILKEWAQSDNEYIRRFASESTRPRGVWCAHIDELKENPILCIDILNTLKSDPSKYVRDSVGNWLNDATKTQPEFVSSLCEIWLKNSPVKETKQIIKKALRTIKKNE